VGRYEKRPFYPHALNPANDNWKTTAGIQAKTYAEDGVGENGRLRMKSGDIESSTL